MISRKISNSNKANHQNFKKHKHPLIKINHKKQNNSKFKQQKLKKIYQNKNYNLYNKNNSKMLFI